MDFFEINPELAGRLNIKDHDQVWIESSRGKIKTLAKIYPGSLPDIIYIPLGQGHNAYGRYARGIGINPLSLMDNVCFR